MFRWVAIFLLLCLPLQWTAAAVGPIDEPACACASALADDIACGHPGGCGGADDSAAGCCGDCGHGQIPAGLLGAVTCIAHAPADAVAGAYQLRIPDPVPDHLLRPPSATPH